MPHDQVAPETAVEDEPFLEQSVGDDKIVLVMSQPRGSANSVGPHIRRRFLGSFGTEEGGQPSATLAEMTVTLPEGPESRRELQSQGDLRGVASPRQRRSHVVVFRLEPCQPCRLLGAAKGACRLSSQLQVILRVAAEHCLLAAGLQLLESKRAHRLQLAEGGLCLRRADLDDPRPAGAYRSRARRGNGSVAVVRFPTRDGLDRLDQVGVDKGAQPVQQARSSSPTSFKLFAAHSAHGNQGEAPAKAPNPLNKICSPSERSP